MDSDDVMRFQPFLRFWRLRLLDGLLACGEDVSTLLEILVERIAELLGKFEFKFQPFLRFWQDMCGTSAGDIQTGGFNPS